jgi:chemotaxis methyl-accepting protein methylase
VSDRIAGADPTFDALLDKIARERQFQCSSYKERCLRRRIAVRLRARNVATYEAYAALLDEDGHEYDKLLDALTINVTKLFRNWETYEALRRLVVPTLWSSPAPFLNVWSAGCASGEEAYSLAILFHQYALATGEEKRLHRVRVVGTDIDRESLEAAARAAYGKAAFADTPIELRESYFSSHSPALVDPRIRALVQFSVHDLIRQDPPVGQHLIACRNVIIYFDRRTQEQLFERFHASLAPGGFLVLGKVETLLGETRRLYTAIDARERIFQRV